MISVSRAGASSQSASYIAQVETSDQSQLSAKLKTPYDQISAR
jgi:hypothetical protein